MGSSTMRRSDRSPASQRVVRVMAVTLQAAALILTCLNLPPLITQAEVFPLWWTLLAVLAVPGCALAAVVSARWIDLRWLQILCGTQASLILAALLLVPVALSGERLAPSVGAPWLTELCVIAGAASAVCWGVRGAVPYGVALQVTVFVLVFVSDGDPIPGPALSDAILGVFYVTLFTALAITLRQAGLILDRTIETAVREAVESATADATRVGTRRVASLVHDSVIVALLTYSNATGPSPAAASEAQRALAAVGSLDQDEPSMDRRPLDLAWDLQGLTTELDIEAIFDYSVDTDEAVPANVAQATTGAASEALRNSLRHARPDAVVTREVRVTISDAGVNVIVLDDGDGFVVDDIPPSRLGIRQAIIGRMASVPGGRAFVRSTPGYGTIVSLQWTRHEGT